MTQSGHSIQYTFDRSSLRNSSPNSSALCSKRLAHSGNSGDGALCKPGQQQLRINRATLSLQYNAAGNHTKDAILAHEAVFKKNPFAVPTDHARVNFEGLKYFEVMTKLSGRIADDRKRFVLSCNSKKAGAHNPMHATNMGERKVSTIVDVEVVIQVVWPYAQTDTSGREKIDFSLANQA